VKVSEPALGPGAKMTVAEIKEALKSRSRGRKQEASAKGSRTEHERTTPGVEHYSSTTQFRSAFVLICPYQFVVLSLTHMHHRTKPSCISNKTYYQLYSAPYN
jgi:hypothetical protein